MTKTFTSESVCAGHPDKICDRISDAILDAVLTADPLGRVAVETLVTTNKVIVAGEVTTKAKINYPKIVKTAIQELGYTDPLFDFSDNSPLELYVHQQSADIAVGVDQAGAGDQGMMFGYACSETSSLMPMPIMVAHALTKAIDTARVTNLKYLRPDGKSQVTIEYNRDQPTKARQVVLAVPYQENISKDQLQADLYKLIIVPVLAEFGLSIPQNQIIINGTGVWHIGGPASDTGLTGRKIIVDGYGGYARVGGGAFSGKDPTKVDRSGAYAARFLAKNIVAQKLAKKCEVRLAYFIGAKKPSMQEVETFGTATASDKVIQDFINGLLDTSVAGILETLDLRRPIYTPTSSYGHFGRPEFPWEKIV